MKKSYILISVGTISLILSGCTQNYTNGKSGKLLKAPNAKAFAPLFLPEQKNLLQLPSNHLALPAALPVFEEQKNELNCFSEGIESYYDYSFDKEDSFEVQDNFFSLTQDFDSIQNINFPALNYKESSLLSYQETSIRCLEEGKITKEELLMMAKEYLQDTNYQFIIGLVEKMQLCMQDVAFDQLSNYTREKIKNDFYKNDLISYYSTSLTPKTLVSDFQCFLLLFCHRQLISYNEEQSYISPFDFFYL